MPADCQTGKMRYNNPGYDIAGQPFTISKWVYLDAYAPGGGGSYFWHCDTLVPSGTFRHYFRVREAADGDLVLTVAGNPSGVSRRTNSGLLPLGVWTNVIATYDGGTVQTGIHIYVNGTEATYAAGANFSGSFYDGGGFWTIGGNAVDSARSTDGRIHKDQVWSRVLTSDEIAFLAAGGDPATITTGKVFAAPYDTSTDATDINGATLTATTTGTVAMTTQYPANTPGLAAWHDFGNGSNTVTLNRLATLLDKSGNGNSLTQSGTSGPAVRTSADTAIGIGQVHANFSMTDTNATTFSETYVQLASGSGGTWNARNMTVLLNVVARNTPATDTLSDPNCVINFGDPTAAGANAGVCRISIERGGKIVCIDSAGAERLSGAFFDEALPRTVALVFSGSSVKIRIAGVNFTLTAMAAASATGMRFGTRSLNAATTNYFSGDGYQSRVYQRALSDTEIDALTAIDNSAYGLRAPTRAICLSCTSTGAGYYATDNVTPLKLIAAHYPDALFFNGSAASQKIADLISIYPNDCAQFATFCGTMGVVKGNRHFMGIMMANDFIYLASTVPPDPNYDTDAEIIAGNQSYINTALASFATFTLYKAIVRGDCETQGDGLIDDPTRETKLTTWFGALTNCNKSDRPPLLIPASSQQADLDAVDGNATYYNADTVHMILAGFKLWGTRTSAGVLVAALNAAMDTGGGRSRNYRSRNWR